ncbi:glycosyltransferase family 4 protein [Zobellia roscoffensis]|uniref:glycosyltransferase family 4 protein n=1 Tax=Zobellia roscoffensis TaxID=2779508 RepID=UPI001D04555C|nr:glycosyltransferase family 4 protein [Zobellia roscoffensis]
MIKNTIKRKVCHLTTVHVRYDTRIFVKECCCLAEKEYDVTLIVADGKGDEDKNGVRILDVGKPSGRIKRVLHYHKIILSKALELNADIFHFHDPELLRIGTNLKKKGKIVIYDSHEDVPRQVLDKAYLPSFLRRPLSKIIERYENKIVSQLSGVVTVTPNLERRFLITNKNVVQVCNFPKIQEFEIVGSQNIVKEDAVCYVGAISKVRGVLNMVDAMRFSNGAKLLLGGKFENEGLREETVKSKGWKNVEELGFLSRDEVRVTLEKSVAGLVVLEPTKSYVDSIPVKMFEYMIAGIPVVASDFSYWRELIEKENCALFVDPQKPEDIGKAIKTLVNERQRASEMGLRGRKAVLEKFNWASQEKKLIAFYDSFS